MITIDDIYAAINPMPAMLSAKGKVRPDVTFMAHANSRLTIHMSWKRPFVSNDWETDCECFSGETFEESLEKATAFINELPSADQAKLNHFMGKLGGLIDAGRDEGINVDYLNPLIDTMKRISENVITFQPVAAQ